MYGGTITSVKEVTDKYQKKQKMAKGRVGQANAPVSGNAEVKGAAYALSTLLDLYVPEQGFSGRVRRGTKVPVGVEQPAGAYGSEVVALLGSGGANIGTDLLIKFLAFEINEEVGAYRTVDVTVPPEDLTFPPWYGENYKTQKIGGLYSYYFGVGAITDPTVVLGASEPRRFGDGEEARTLYLEFENKLSQLEGAAGHTIARGDQKPVAGLSDIAGLPGGAQPGPPGKPSDMDVTLGNIKARSPVSVAIEELVRAYSATRTQHYDTPQFVQNYTWRPIATMVDLFGTADLTISDIGMVVSGREGFHSRAFGDYDDLRQLAFGAGGYMPQTILGLSTSARAVSTDKEEKDAAISARLDTRKEKRLAVQRYLYALATARGVLMG
jgi:hypothetical protein